MPRIINAGSDLLMTVQLTTASGLFRSQLDLYGDGYTVAEGMKTAKPRVFVAGDINDRVCRQVVTACSSGCMAALEAERFLTRSLRG